MSKRHETSVYWGDWHVFAYCKEPGCGWEGTRTNHYYAISAGHYEAGLRHTKKMNRWWRRLLARAAEYRKAVE